MVRITAWMLVLCVMVVYCSVDNVYSNPLDPETRRIMAARERYQSKPHIRLFRFPGDGSSKRVIFHGFVNPAANMVEPIIFPKGNV